MVVLNGFNTIERFNTGNTYNNNKYKDQTHFALLNINFVSYTEFRQSLNTLLNDFVTE